jgi:hypothetical protein
VHAVAFVTRARPCCVECLHRQRDSGQARPEGAAPHCRNTQRGVDRFRINCHRRYRCPVLCWKPAADIQQLEIYPRPRTDLEDLSCPRDRLHPAAGFRLL